MLIHLPRVLAELLVVASILPLAEGGRAASPEPGDPTFNNLRYNDDFSYLADPVEGQPDPWDPINISDRRRSIRASFLSSAANAGAVRILPQSKFRHPSASTRGEQRLSASTAAAEHRSARHRLIPRFLQLGEWNASATGRGVDHRHRPASTSCRRSSTQAADRRWVTRRIPGRAGGAPVRLPAADRGARGTQRAARFRRLSLQRPNRWRVDRSDRRAAGERCRAAYSTMIPTWIKYLWGAYLTVPLGADTKIDLYELNYEIRRRSIAA